MLLHIKDLVNLGSGIYSVSIALINIFLNKYYPFDTWFKAIFMQNTSVLVGMKCILAIYNLLVKRHQFYVYCLFESIGEGNKTMYTCVCGVLKYAPFGTNVNFFI